MKNKFKKIINKKNIFIFILGGIVFSFISVSAVNLIYSKDVTYDNTSSGLSSTTVQGALDELYESAKNGGTKVSCNDNGECTVTCKTGNPTITDTGYSCPNMIEVNCKDGEQFTKKSDTSYECSISAIAPSELKKKSVTIGDGLYKDSVTSGRYFYRGSSPNNYITFNGEMWRIISVESDNKIKIVRNEQLSATKEWDSESHRNEATSTYCVNASWLGCNAWASNSNLIDSPSNFTQYYPNGNTSDSTNYTGTVTQDSTMSTYLNETYYDSLSNTTKSKIVKGVFNVSTPGSESDTESLETDAVQEKQYQWKGYVGLYTATELLRACTNTTCKNLNVARNSGMSSPCNKNNWLWPTTSTSEFTLSTGAASNRTDVWYVYAGKYAGTCGSFNSLGIRPVVFLSNTITLKGTGTSSDPYTIVS